MKPPIRLPLDKMSVEERIQAMDSLRDDPYDRAESFESPAWHREVLAERETTLQNGDDKFIDC
jgi:hypothetical protein